jgi:hypothetical protein
MAEEKRRVTLEDVVEVLAKHSSTPNDPDDAQTLTDFNQQVIDEKNKAAEQPVSATKGKP